MGQEWAQNGLITHKNAHERILGKIPREENLPQITWTEETVLQ